jgi:sulfoxide reductase catalytic subunit YedY
MLIQSGPRIRSSEITPRSVYLNRRRFLSGSLGLGALAASVPQAEAKFTNLKESPFNTKEPETPYKVVTTYNNYYEFGTSKDQPAKYAGTLQTRPWAVKVEGEVAKPQTLDIDSILKLAPLEERIYRHRCVEGWSIVVPWVGYSLSEILRRAEPTSKAKFVAFQSFYNSKQMPLGRYAGIQLPYVEGLRLDEAMNPLTLLCVGLYGDILPNQNGAPVRIVVPWKYGFKSIKSIVKIKLVDKQPTTTWNLENPHEYGFYSNVNPHVDHPRWGQATERRLGDFFKRPTLMFNGYGDQVASMYAGMDLRKYF